MAENLIDLSIVAPVYNEEGNIAELHREITDALKDQNLNYEIIFCDDGSSDQSVPIMRKLAGSDPRLKVIVLRRNYGQTGATSTLFENSRGKVIIAMDSDRQNDPADIMKLYHKIHEGYDMVSGWRKDRKDNFIFRKLPSLMAHKLITTVTQVKLHDYGCSLKAYRREVIEHVRLYGDMHRFVPVFVKNAGAKIAELPVNHRARTAGVSKYGLSRTYRVLLDLLTVLFIMRFFNRPMHFFGFPGFLFLGAGTVSGAYLTFIKLAYQVDIGTRPLLLFSILTLIMGTIFLSIGLLGEVMIRVFHETSRSPAYLVREIINDERK